MSSAQDVLMQKGHPLSQASDLQPQMVRRKLDTSNEFSIEEGTSPARRGLSGFLLPVHASDNVNELKRSRSRKVWIFEGMYVMEKEGRSNQRAKEHDFVLQWGTKKRHRGVKVKNKDKVDKNNNNSSFASRNSNGSSNNNGGGDGRKLLSESPGRRKISSSSGVNSRKEKSPLRSLHRNSEAVMNKRKSSQASPEEDRIYTTRGSLGPDDNGKVFPENNVKNDKGTVIWPKLFLSLSSKEKEEDFMAMKGCKLPQRPKKRAKLIQRSVFLVSPGSWLSDLSQERYEVKEKKASKKKPRGLKAMGGMESDSE
ncbi:hypothetical protein MLD38_004245 [Melastoma candidum]|uniref:Uncharacterized protein n=1 Tax=Melastoma candidum TaxID=119954 RepID=A0ACB9S5G9_9MYRT|nr:hypothetical protein MLD38_004245 [Melastoma candidum]